jgi:type I restriction enzyme S subunit
VRLHHIAEVNPPTREFEAAPDDANVTFVPLEAVWPSGRLDISRVRPRSEVATGYTRFRNGDVLVPKITPTFEAGRSAVAWGLQRGFGCGTTELHVIRPKPGIEPRFLCYVAQSRPFLDEGSSAMTGVAGQQRVPDLFLRDFPVVVAEPDRQRAIADFLDAETARIDALMSSRARFGDLLAERCAGVVESAVRALASSYGEMPLRHGARELTVGIVVTPAAWYADEGALALRGVNVRPGGFNLDDVVRLSAEGHRVHGKSQLQAGDLVVVRTGQAGAAAVVPPELDGANCIDLLIIRPGPALLPDYLELVLNSDWTQKHIEEHSVGTIQAHFNVSALKALPVPVPPVEIQRQVVNSLSSATRRLDQLREHVERQIVLLRERRQALITAAVTGELEIAARREAS